MSFTKPSASQRPTLEYHKEAITKKQVNVYIEFKKDNTPKTSVPLTVVVVAYNESDLLLSLLKNLTTAKNQKKAHVIVLDNGLDAAIAEKIISLPILYIKASGNLGCTHGRNVASAFVNTELMSFLDADAKIEKSYIDDTIVVMKKGLVCVRGKVIPITKGSHPSSTYNLGETVMPCPPTAEGISVWRTKDYIKAGGFENSLYGGEGVVLYYRMIELLGYKPEQFIYNPLLTLYHDYNNNPAHLVEKSYRNHINRYITHLFYPLMEKCLAESRQVINRNRTNKQPINRKTEQVLRKALKKFEQDTEKIYTKNAERRMIEADKPYGDGTYAVSVIIPCYNLGGYLKKAVTSVMRQSIHNLEIIVVDDKSTDVETLKVLKELENNVTVIYRKKNGGASAARNTGIKQSKSPIILCLDADDAISETYLEEAVNVFKISKDIGIVSCNVKVTGIRKDTWLPKDNPTLTDALISSPLPNASCVRKKAYESVGGYDENLRGNEDWELWISLLEKGWGCKIIRREHYKYQTRHDSKITKSNKKAEYIAEYIAKKHRKSYEKNLVEVLAKKHKILISQRTALYEARSIVNRMYSVFAVKQFSSLHRKLAYMSYIAINEKDYNKLAFLFGENIRKLSNKIIRK